MGLKPAFPVTHIFEISRNSAKNFLMLYLLVDTPTMPSNIGGAAITKLTNPPAMETICA